MFFKGIKYDYSFTSGSRTSHANVLILQSNNSSKVVTATCGAVSNYATYKTTYSYSSSTTNALVVHIYPKKKCIVVVSNTPGSGSTGKSYPWISVTVTSSNGEKYAFSTDWFNGQRTNSDSDDSEANFPLLARSGDDIQLYWPEQTKIFWYSISFWDVK